MTDGLALLLIGYAALALVGFVACMAVLIRRASRREL